MQSFHIWKLGEFRNLCSYEVTLRYDNALHSSKRLFQNLYVNSKPRYLIMYQKKKLGFKTFLSCLAKSSASSRENSSSPSSSIISSICSLVKFVTSRELRALITLLRLSSTEPFHLLTSIAAKIILHRTSSYAKLFCFALTHFWSMLPFYKSWKHPKIFDFLVFSGGIKQEHWPEIGKFHIQKNKEPINKQNQVCSSIKKRTETALL